MVIFHYLATFGPYIIADVRLTINVIGYAFIFVFKKFLYIMKKNLESKQVM